MFCFEVWSCRWSKKLSRPDHELETYPNPNPEIYMLSLARSAAGHSGHLPIGLFGAPTFTRTKYASMSHHVDLTYVTAIMA